MGPGHLLSREMAEIDRNHDVKQAGCEIGQRTDAARPNAEHPSRDGLDRETKFSPSAPPARLPSGRNSPPAPAWGFSLCLFLSLCLLGPARRTPEEGSASGRQAVRPRPRSGSPRRRRAARPRPRAHGGGRRGRPRPGGHRNWPALRRARQRGPLRRCPPPRLGDGRP